MYRFNGIRVVCSDNALTKSPTIQIRSGIVMSDGFREEMDAWLAKTFGYKYNVYLTRDDLILGEEVLVMHSHMFDQLKKAAVEMQPYV